MNSYSSRDWTGCVQTILTCVLFSMLVACSGSSSKSDSAPDPAPIVGSTPDPDPKTEPDPDPDPVPGVAPELTFTAGASVIADGGSVTLNWSATNATSCTASGGWSGSQQTSGTLLVGPLTQNTTFSLTCSGDGGNVIEMLMVSVEGQLALSWTAPTENVDGTPLTDLAGYRIYYGDSSRDYSDMADVADPVATTHSITLISGSYYVAMTALDADGNESAYSNEVVKITQ